MTPSLNELMKLVLDILPNATFSEDSERQIVIHSNLQQADPDDDQPLVNMGDC